MADMDWERGFSSESAMIGEKEMEEFRSEKSVTVGKVSRTALLQQYGFLS